MREERIGGCAWCIPKRLQVGHSCGCRAKEGCSSKVCATACVSGGRWSIGRAVEDTIGEKEMTGREMQRL